MATSPPPVSFENQSDTFFAHVGDDLNFEIAQWALIKPNDSEEDAYKMIDVMFSDKSIFSSASQTLFHVLRVHYSEKVSIANHKIELKYGGDLQQTEKVLRACAGSLKKIELTGLCDIGLNGELCLHASNQFIDLIAQVQPKVSSLTFGGDISSEATKYALEKLSPAIGNQLLTLEFESSMLESAIGTIPVGVIAPHLSQLRSFTFSGLGLHHLLPLWRTVGKTLEEVYVESPERTFWTLTIGCLHAYCRKLKSIILEDPFNDLSMTEDAYRNFLISYGDQLVSAEICRLNAESCSEVVAACPNLRCQLLECENDFRRAGALGRALESLILFVEEEDDWGSLSNALVKCSRLRSIDADVVVRSDFTKHLFNNRLDRLEELDLKLRTRVLKDGALECVARATGSLRSLRLCALRIESGREFDALVDANKNLESVRVEELDQNGRPKERVVPFLDDLIKPFLLCNRLLEFCSRTFMNPTTNMAELEKDIATALQPLQHKRVAAKIILAVVHFARGGE